MKYEKLCNRIGGMQVPFAGEHLDVISPVDGTPLSTVPLSTAAEVDQVVAVARDAFEPWSACTIKERSQVFFRYRELLRQHIDELADLVREENGKTRDEGRAEIAKAMEVTEFACSLPQLTAGEVLEVSPGVECRVELTSKGKINRIYDKNSSRPPISLLPVGILFPIPPSAVLKLRMYVCVSVYMCVSFLKYMYNNYNKYNYSALGERKKRNCDYTLFQIFVYFSSIFLGE